MVEPPPIRGGLGAVKHPYLELCSVNHSEAGTFVPILPLSRAIISAVGEKKF